MENKYFKNGIILDDNKNNKKGKNKILIGNSILAIVILTIAIIISMLNIFTNTTETKSYLSKSKLSVMEVPQGNLSINVNDINNNPIEGAKFEVYSKDQLQKIPYSEVVPNGEYYFEEKDGKLVPNNIGVDTYDYAYSYIKIDLTDKDDMYLKLNAEKFGGNYANEFYAIISDSTEFPDDYDNESFLHIEDDTPAKNYFKFLEGGKVYYLHLMYVNSYGNPLESFVINDISLMQEPQGTNGIDYAEANGKYYFEKKDGKLLSNNKGISSSTANSYIKLDLTNTDFDVELKINAEISSESGCDYGYVNITDSTDAPAYNDGEGQLLKISGKQAAQNYTQVLEGGKVYYIHIGYRKDNSVNKYDDQFTINAISVGSITQTNSEGKINIQLPYGEYYIEEVGVPEQYTIEDNAISEVTIDKEDTQLNLTNLGKKVAIISAYGISDLFYEPDASQIGNRDNILVPLQEGGYAEEYTYLIKRIGEEYETSPLEGVDENYMLAYTPSNASGIVDDEWIEVYYVYIPKTYTINLTKIDETNNEIKIPGTRFETSTTFNRIIIEEALLEVHEPKYITQEIKNEYTTDENGNINMDTLFVGKEYTLKEVLPTDGYVKEDLEVKFKVTVEDGKFVINFIEGNIENVNIVDNQINITLENKPSFKLIKKNTDGEPLQGAKFTIVTEDGTEAINGTGEFVGEVENIDGVDQRVVTTDENGEIYASLPTGKYTITEVQAPEGYRIPEENVKQIEIKQDEVYEEVSVSVEKKMMNLEYLYKSLNLEDFDFNEYNNMQNYIAPEPTDIIFTLRVAEILPTGEMVLTGYVMNNTVISGEGTVSGENINIELPETVDAEGILIVTDKIGKIDKVITIPSESGASRIVHHYKTEDGYILIGQYIGNIHIPAEETVNNKEIILEQDTMPRSAMPEIQAFIAKVTNQGKFEYAIDLGNVGDVLETYGIQQLSEIGIFGTKDNNFTVKSVVPEEITIPADMTVTNEEIVIEPGLVEFVIGNQGKFVEINKILTESELYNISGIFENIMNESEYTELNTIKILEDGSCIMSLDYEDLLYVPGEYMMSGNDYYNMIYGPVIIKINKLGKVEYIYSFDDENEVYTLYTKDVSNGETLVSGYYYDNLYIPAKDTTYGRDITLTANNEYGDSGYILKLDSNGKVVWAANADTYTDNICMKEYEGDYYIMEYGDDDYYALHKVVENKTQTGIINKQQELNVVNEKKEANIVAEKSFTTQNGLDYVVKDETIKYTVTLENTGDWYKDVVIKDTIPEGTEFVPGSIKINDSSSYTLNDDTIDLTSKTELDLSNGITVNMQAGQKLTLSFEVKALYNAKDYVIENVALVDENKTNNTEIKYKSPVAQIGYDIVKNGPDKIVSENDPINYDIIYTSKITEYMGDAQVIITDYLPYAIDEEQSNIADGIYNEEEKTITWIQDIKDIDSYNNVNNNINIVKNISLVFKDVDYSLGSFTNNVTGKITLEATDQEREIKTSKTTGIELERIITVNKIWDDNNNIKGNRPQSVTVILTANGKEIEKVELSDTNNWTYTFDDLQIKDNQGKEIVYDVKEEETNVGDLKYYDEPIIVNNGDTINITNKYKLLDAELNSKIEKIGPEIITNEKDELTYTIKYNAVITDYIGQANVTIVDYLPYEIDQEKSDLAGGTYDNESKTITWKENVENINTIENGDYTVNIEKVVKLVYKDLKITDKTLTNKATGTIDLYDSETTNTVETEFESEVDIPSRVVVKYVDEQGNEISSVEVIEGMEGTSYVTQLKDIENYELVRVYGNAEGTLTNEEQEVYYVYRKIEAKVIVRYLEKDNTPEDDTDNKILAEEEVIEGYSGDEYTTQRKDIENYKAADPEPENSTGKMTKEDIYVTYYYEKVQSGTVTAIYVDTDTNEEIKYIDADTKEEKTYKEEIKGYIGDKYITKAKEIPYYAIVEDKIPENAEGIYGTEDVLVTYYYKKLPFNISVDKNLTKIELNGEKQEVINGKINKVEIPVGRVSDSTLKLEYSIKVSNTGEVEGSTEVIERLPEFFNIAEGTSSEWKKQSDGTLKLTANLKAGETKEYKVVVNWERGSNNFGALENVVELANISNPANFTESNLEDNTSKSELVLSVKSGEDRSMVIITLTFGLLLLTAGSIILIKKKVLKK